MALEQVHVFRRALAKARIALEAATDRIRDHEAL